MHSEGEEVRLNLEAEWQYEELVHMAVDSGEEEWSRLHDVKLNGMVNMIEFNKIINRPFLVKHLEGTPFYTYIYNKICFYY